MWLKDFIDKYILTFGVKILGAVLLIVVGFIIINSLKKRFTGKKLFKNADPTVSSFALNFISAALKVILILSAVIIVGVPSATVVAILGSCGLAVGLALQGGLSNLAGGVLILVLRPFKIGDYIIAAGVEGTVDVIGIFYTTLLTVDNKRVVIPNSSVCSGTVTNCSSEKTRRIDLNFSVSANSDLDKVRSIFKNICDTEPLILKDPAPDILISELGAAYVKFFFRPWCESGNYWDLYFKLTERVKREFTANGIDAPVEKMAVRSLDN